MSEQSEKPTAPSDPGEQPSVPPAPYPPAPYPPAGYPSGSPYPAGAPYPTTPYQPPVPPTAPTSPYGFSPPARSLPQWQAYLKMQLSAGRPPMTLLAEMNQSGVPAPQAYQLMHKAIGELRNRAFLAIGIGIAVAIVGLLVTVSTMNNAETSGGYYVIWYGPMAIGIVGVAYGLLLLRKVPHL